MAVLEKISLQYIPCINPDLHFCSTKIMNSWYSVRSSQIISFLIAELFLPFLIKNVAGLASHSLV